MVSVCLVDAFPACLVVVVDAFPSKFSILQWTTTMDALHQPLVSISPYKIFIKQLGINIADYK